MNGKWVVARVEHRCNQLCDRKIRIGETYWYEKVGPPDHPDNDYWFAWKCCVECKRAWEAIGDTFDWEFPFGEHLEWIRALVAFEALPLFDHDYCVSWWTAHGEGTSGRNIEQRDERIAAFLEQVVGVAA